MSTYDRPDYHSNPVFTRVTYVTESLFLANKMGSGDEILQRLGINCLICATESHEVGPPNYPYCEFLRVPVPKDPSGPNIIQYFDDVADMIHSIERRGGRTMVHSLNGVSRGPTLVIAYLMKYKKMPLSNAFGMVLGLRPCIQPYSGFWKQLIRYEKELFGRNSVSF